MLEGVKTINGIPLDVCLNILRTDDWFNNATDEKKKRRLNWTKNNDNIQFKNVFRYDKDEKPNNTNDIGTKITFTELLTDSSNRMRLKKENINTPGLLAALVFTVNGNGGPYKTFCNNISHISAFINKNNTPVAKAYVNHICWVVNNSWALDWDNVVKMVGKEHYRVPKEQQYDIFSYLLGKKELFVAYNRVFEANPNNKDLQMDVSRFTLYSKFKPLIKLPAQANTRTGTRRSIRRPSTRRTKTTRLRK